VRYPDGKARVINKQLIIIKKIIIKQLVVSFFEINLYQVLCISIRPFDREVFQLSIKFGKILYEVLLESEFEKNSIF
jgi:hypothetical protein